MDRPSDPSRRSRRQRPLGSPPGPTARLGSLCGATLLLAGCLGPNARPADRPEPRPILDDYTLVEAHARSLAGCRYDYRVFEPLAGPDGAVVIGHGFLRDQDREVGLARALANAGHRAITLDFCNMRPWNGHHVRNAADMRALAELHGVPGRTVYAGFSAGALAALLAGADDPTTPGVVALDLVDQADLGVEAVTRLNAPLLGLAGPPAACNAAGNGRPLFALSDAPRSSLESVNGATHCDFEQPSDWLCELACGESPALAGSASASSPAAVGPTRRERIVERTVALVDSLLGGDEPIPNEPAISDERAVSVR